MQSLQRGIKDKDFGRLFPGEKEEERHTRQKKWFSQKHMLRTRLPCTGEQISTNGEQKGRTGMLGFSAQVSFSPEGPAVAQVAESEVSRWHTQA